MRRLLRGNATKVERYLAPTDSSTAADADGTVTYAVTDANGSAVTSGNATNESENGRYTFVLAAQPAVRDLDVVWAGTWGGQAREMRESLTVVGARYFELSELRGLKGLESPTDFSDLRLVIARDLAEELIDDFTETAWVPHYAREVGDGNDLPLWYVDQVPARKLLAVTVAGVSQVLTGWTLSLSGKLRSTGAPFGTAASSAPGSVTAGQDVVVEYEHGHSDPPADLKHKAALPLARHVLLDYLSSIPDRANLMTTEFATFQLATASEKNPTGFPEVDAVLRRYRREHTVLA